MKVKVTRSLDDLNFLIIGLKKSSKSIGSIAAFVGTVRGTWKDEKVLRLEYEAHETLALQKMRKIIREAKSKHRIIDAVIEHCIGAVSVGEDVMYVLVASEHREEGFMALAEIVNRVKHEVPIWKKEITDKGTYWVENP